MTIDQDKAAGDQPGAAPATAGDGGPRDDVLSPAVPDEIGPPLPGHGTQQRDAGTQQGESRPGASTATSRQTAAPDAGADAVPGPGSEATQDGRQGVMQSGVQDSGQGETNGGTDVATDVAPAAEETQTTALPRSLERRERAAGLTFEALEARALRLVDWAGEESDYIREHDVASFSAADRAGRDQYADEGLYDLLPRLLNDAALLRLRCGRGPLWDLVRQRCDQAAQDVQAYVALWHELRDATDPR